MKLLAEDTQCPGVPAEKPPGKAQGERRVLIVLRALDMGGSQRQALHLARELLRTSAVRVAVWTLEKGGDLVRELALAGIPWENHPAVIGRRGAGKILPVIALIRSLRRWHPDAIIPFNDFPNKICGAVWRVSGARVCIWNQRDEGREVTGRVLERLALRQARIFVSNSSQGADFLIKNFGIAKKRISVIPNGVKLDPPKRTRAEWRSGMGIGPQAVLVAMVANVHRYKDHETLLQAWSQLKKKAPGMDLHLLLAGRHGDTYPMLRDLCRDLQLEASVHFLGLVEDIPGLLAASDAAVFSSHLEGMPNGVLEGMAAGLPMVATRIPGISEALGDDYPLLVPPQNAPALAASLLALVGDEKLRGRLGRQNQRRAGEEFSVERMGKRYLDLLDPFLAGSLGKAQ